MMETAFGQVLNLPLRAQKLIALGMLGVVTAFVALATSVGWVMLQDLRSERQDLRLTAGQMQRIASIKLTDAKSEAEAPNLILTASSTSVAQSQLQTRIDSIASGAEATIISIGAAQDLEIDTLTYVGISSTMTGTMAAVYGALSQIELANEVILVRDLVVRLAETPANREPELTIQFRTYAPFAEGADATTDGLEPVADGGGL